MKLSVMMDPKKPLTVRIQWSINSFSNSWQDLRIISEDDMLTINAWVLQSNLGKRMSFDTWKLKNAEAVTAFVLYWDNREW